ncbi:hypothetical protein HS088_TW01G00690 [Tripterygium wilfordii]|uniref:Uncharacterized protein n=1 Tax=Tripterygium wilfordii TaxID=458696 RepID=A0A7J7E283_TRIWF|nr:hypothetical protein HS088_TW01G00690 [Tripterygium wilfordii]
MEKEKKDREKIVEVIKNIPQLISRSRHLCDEVVVKELDSSMTQVEEFVTDRFEELTEEEVLTYTEHSEKMQEVKEFLKKRITNRANFKNKEEAMEEEKHKHEDAVELLTKKMSELNIFKNTAEERKEIEIDSPELFAAEGIGKKRPFWVTRTQLEESAITEGIEKNESRGKRLKSERVQQMDLEESTVFKKLLETEEQDQEMPSLESDTESSTEASSDDSQDSDFF